MHVPYFGDISWVYTSNILQQFTCAEELDARVASVNLSPSRLATVAIYCGSDLLRVFHFQCEHHTRAICNLLNVVTKFYAAILRIISQQISEMEEKREWTKQDTENFIEAVESYHEIWDVHNRDFKDRMKKMCALNEISPIFDTSVKEVQRKWHNLKTQFSQEVRKLQKIKSCSSGIVSDSWWPYFSAMKFLESSVATTSNRIPSLSTKEEEIVTGDDVPVANEGKKQKRD
ncbi:uncharacterized protein LOC126295002 [Schistocerca gregaria]|uniref:uncharacterized protein LOC126295002 n=1 Tax=Schistocerca gregaria TaxID=7010 RepID=UPI00211EB35F|nr:uncharacterized protein LOC126295002 [Schistocerca gregaria]